MAKPIEELLTDLIAAVEANTAALKAGGSASAPGTTTSAAAGKAAKTTTTKAKETEPAKPKHSFDDVTSLVLKTRDLHGKDVVVPLLNELGFEKLAMVEGKTDKYDEVYAAFEKKLDELENSGSSDDDI